MSKQFDPKYLNDCVDHALDRCRQVTPIRKDVLQTIRWALEQSHETDTSLCRDLRNQLKKRVSRLRALASWERYLLGAAKGLLMPQPGTKTNHVLPECRLALDELETHFYSTYQAAIPQRNNPDWRYNYSWICQEADWQQ